MGGDTRTQILIAGAGASGLCAAIHAARAGAQVLVLEKGEKPGKKLSVTGNGRGNLSHLPVRPEDYNPSARPRMRQWLSCFDTAHAVSFFLSLGIVMADEEGYLYPLSGKANQVTDAMLAACDRLGVEILTGRQLKAIDVFGTGAYILRTGDGTEISAEAVILAMGGLAGERTLGATGDGYYLCERLGMALTERHPALTGLQTDRVYLPREGGVRQWARVTLLHESGGREEVLATETGELQMTGEGFSGIPVLQMSGMAAQALAAGKELTVEVDFFPGLSEDGFDRLADGLSETEASCSISAWLSGCLDRRLVRLVLAMRDVDADLRLSELQRDARRKLLRDLRQMRFPVTGTGDFRHAQVTAGGVRLDELNDQLMSVRNPGLFCIGEMT
ncbi:MAG: aminoacetone oxidase family FAD-binding enzyme, partial [Butyrivibrio sp.]|nr:aminoacetone oxidase family FAD-binding enzyme [Butyrivibrio sp.]